MRGPRDFKTWLGRLLGNQSGTAGEEQRASGRTSQSPAIPQRDSPSSTQGAPSTLSGTAAPHSWQRVCTTRGMGGVAAEAAPTPAAAAVAAAGGLRRYAACGRAMAHTAASAVRLSLDVANLALAQGEVTTHVMYSCAGGGLRGAGGAYHPCDVAGGAFVGAGGATCGRGEAGHDVAEESLAQPIADLACHLRGHRLLPGGAASGGRGRAGALGRRGGVAAHCGSCALGQLCTGLCALR